MSASALNIKEEKIPWENLLRGGCNLRKSQVGGIKGKKTQGPSLASREKNHPPVEDQGRNSLAAEKKIAPRKRKKEKKGRLTASNRESVKRI